MSGNTSDAHHQEVDSGGAAAAAAGHIAVQIPDSSEDRQECRTTPDLNRAVSGSAATQQCTVDGAPADMGQTSASLQDNLLAADCLMDAGESSQVRTHVAHPRCHKSM